MSKYFHFFGDTKIQNIFDKEEIIALQKMSKGKANEYEQKLGYKVIVEKLCRIAHSSFTGDNNLTNFNEGVRWVGVKLAQAIVVDTGTFNNNNKKQ